MKYLVQETDSKIVYPFPSNFSYPVKDQVLETSSGSHHLDRYFSLPNKTPQLSNAWSLINSIASTPDLRYREAKVLLTTIENIIYEFQQLQFDFGRLPQLQSSLTEDGALLFEWIFPNYRLGFAIEVDPKDSSWFLITNESLGAISAYGNIYGLDLHAILLWLLNFILAHA
jgi:hypothetical protein